jgi:hypothetical protein
VGAGEEERVSAAIEAFPLCWPDGWPRRGRQDRKGSDYRVTFIRARDELLRELTAGRARHVVISSNVPLRRDGLPLANMREPEDPGVAVYWDDKAGKPRVIACDVWRTVRENLRAVGLAYASLRQLERTGASELLERAFQGFARLPAAQSCWDILGLARGASRDEVVSRFRALSRNSHPDQGGDAAAFARLTQAYHEALGAN